MMLKVALLLGFAAFALGHPERGQNAPVYATCAEIPSNNDARHAELLYKFSEELKIYFSNIPKDESCLRLGYRTTEINDGLATGIAIMHNAMFAPDGIYSNVTIVELEGHRGWRVYGGMPNVIDFIVWEFDLDEKSPCLCAFTCNPDAPDVLNFRCIATNEDGVRKIESWLLKVKNWPFKGKVQPVRVFNDECTHYGLTQKPAGAF